ncbi:MAG: MGMT family protein [Caldilineaceae bacterium]
MAQRQISLTKPVYQRIYLVTRQIPVGRVATYGQIAAIVGNCTARMVGYAMAAVDSNEDVPWQRVINAAGKISPRSDSASTERQRQLLQQEGVLFNTEGRTNLRCYGWQGPGVTWLLEHGFDPAPQWRE